MMNNTDCATLHEKLQGIRAIAFDADDTLWENNIYFEAAIEEFLDLTADLVGSFSPVAPHRRAVRALLPAPR